MEPPYQRKKIGNEVKFWCKTYNPVKWTFKNFELPWNSKVSGTMNGTLTLSTIELSNAGTYECTMQDGNREFSTTGFLDVKGKTI